MKRKLIDISTGVLTNRRLVKRLVITASFCTKKSDLPSIMSITSSFCQQNDDVMDMMIKCQEFCGGLILFCGGR